MRAITLFFGLVPAITAQSSTDMRQVLERLERIEAENRRLADEVRSLREELHRHDVTASATQTAAATAAAQSPPLDEAVALNSTRVEELAQTKVEASQKFPIRITGMALFNAFLNSRNADTLNPTVASLNPVSSSGATMRQTIIGLEFQGPRTFLGGSVQGSLSMDFFGGTTSALNQLFRLRVGTIELKWNNRSLLVGQDKPIVSPRDPTSLAQVGVSPLTNAGNLWLWQPQARYEERVHFSGNSGVNAQIGLYQTAEGGSIVPTEYAATVPRARPAAEGRFEFYLHGESGRRIEIAPGFHRSTSHVIGRSVDSQLTSVDWLLAPSSRIEFTGMYYTGENIANLGALRQGFTVLANDRVIPVHSAGGWAQLHWQATDRLSFNVFGGQHSDRARDLAPNGTPRNQAFFANGMYRLAPNFLVSLEGGQVRTSYLSNGRRLVNHYDLAFAYLF